MYNVIITIIANKDLVFDAQRFFITYDNFFSGKHY